jgi:hypothetical protein
MKWEPTRVLFNKRYHALDFRREGVAQSWTCPFVPIARAD